MGAASLNRTASQSNEVGDTEDPVARRKTPKRTLWCEDGADGKSVQRDRFAPRTRVYSELEYEDDDEDRADKREVEVVAASQELDVILAKLPRRAQAVMRAELAILDRLKTPTDVAIAAAVTDGTSLFRQHSYMSHPCEHAVRRQRTQSPHAL